MKKGIILLTAGILVLALGMVANAAEVGNISIGGERGQGLSFGLGSEHLTRQMDLQEPSTMLTYPVDFDCYYSGYDIDIYGTGYFDLTRLEEIETIDRYFLEASYKADRFEVYGKYGMARLISKWEHYDLAFGVGPWDDGEEMMPGFISITYDQEQIYIYNPGIAIEKPYELGLERSDWGTFYGGGLKFVIYSTPDFKIALDAQYLSQKTGEMGIFSAAFFAEFLPSGPILPAGFLGNGAVPIEIGMGARIDESQTTEGHVALVFSGAMGKLSPYGGLKFSNMTTKYKGQFFAWAESGTEYVEEPLFPFEYTMQQADSFGMFAGANYHFTPRFTGKFEIRLLDETAFSTALELTI